MIGWASVAKALAPLIPYAAVGVAIAAVVGGYWIMDARLSACKTTRDSLAEKVANRDATIEALKTSNGELHRAVTEQSAATLRLADEGRARQQRAEATIEAINRAQTANRNTIARLEASRAVGGDCASAMALVRAEIP